MPYIIRSILRRAGSLERATQYGFARRLRNSHYCQDRTPPDTLATFGQIARDYLATVKPGWGAHTIRTSKGLIEYALIGGKLGTRPVLELNEIDF